MTMRVLPTNSIPQELWIDNKLIFPENLTEAYKTQLKSLNMLEKAIEGKPDKKKPHGGVSDEETIEHFAYRFPTSGGRIEFLTISPERDTIEISNAILSTFSQGNVSVLDIPGGTGATICSLLTTLALLREKEIIPMLPLTIKIMCGDISVKAMDIYNEIIMGISPYLEKHGIMVVYSSMVWDATRNDQTAELVDNWFELSNSSSEYVIFVSNFTGALSNNAMFESFAPSLSQITARLYNKKYTLVWIEPKKRSTDSFFKKLFKHALIALPWLNRNDDNVTGLHYKMVNPLNKTEYPSGVIVKQFNRI